MRLSCSTPTRAALSIFLALLVPDARAADADWIQWGGPSRDFKVQAGPLADSWPADGPKRVWQRPFPAGYSALVAQDGRLYTMYRDGKQDVVTALDARQGSTIWEHRYDAPTLEDQVLDFGEGPNATPLIVGSRLITIGFTGKMHCLSTADGKPQWSHDLVQAFGGKVQKFGYSASPLLYKGRIITLVGGSTTGVLAFEPQDGTVAWKSGPLDISYASPILIQVDGQDQIAFMTSTEVLGITADGGTVQWRWPCKNKYENNCSTPIFGKGNMLWVTTQMEGGTRMLQLSRSQGKTAVKELWNNNKIRLFHWNAMWLGDTIYATIGDTVTPLAAIDAGTGKVLWRERGFSKAKMVYADRKLILLDEDGRLGLASVSPEKAVVHASVPLLEKAAWTPPTLIGRTLYVRDTTQIMALDIGK